MRPKNQLLYCNSIAYYIHTFVTLLQHSCGCKIHHPVSPRPHLIGHFMSIGVVGSDCLGPYGEHSLVSVAEKS